MVFGNLHWRCVLLFIGLLRKVFRFARTLSGNVSGWFRPFYNGSLIDLALLKIYLLLNNLGIFHQLIIRIEFNLIFLRFADRVRICGHKLSRVIWYLLGRLHPNLGARMDLEASCLNHWARYHLYVLLIQVVVILWFRRTFALLVQVVFMILQF